MVSISYAQDSQWATKRTKFSFLRALELHNMRMKSIQNQHEIPKPVKNKNREKHTSKKNNYSQYSIYVVRQFAYVHGVARISLFLGKNTECGSTRYYFGSSHNPDQTQLGSTKPNIVRLLHR